MQKARRTVAGAALVAAASLVLAACGGNSASSGGGGGAAAGGGAGPRVAAVIKGLDNQFFQSMQKGIEDESSAAGVTTTVDSATSVTDTTGQADKLVGLAGQGYDCYRDARWCAALQGGGEGARGSPRSGRACPGRDGSAARWTAARATAAPPPTGPAKHDPDHTRCARR